MRKPAPHPSTEYAAPTRYRTPGAAAPGYRCCSIGSSPACHRVGSAASWVLLCRVVGSAPPAQSSISLPSAKSQSFPATCQLLLATGHYTRWSSFRSTGGGARLHVRVERRGPGDPQLSPALRLPLPPPRPTPPPPPADPHPP